jgi:amidase
VAVKDIIDMAGVPTTAGSRVLAETAAPAAQDAPCLAGLRAAGGQIVGRTNLHEIALGVTGINPWFGTPQNPLDATRVPGGSSSGSAVAVASGEADLAYGTDTGGSVRIPAACCGISALKTTFGRVPLAGVRPLAPTMDTVGPMARDVAGLVLGMQLLEPGFAPASGTGQVRAGRLRVPAAPEIDEAITRTLRATSWEVTDVDPGDWLTATRYTIPLLVAEAYQANKDLFDQHAGRLSPDVASRLDAGRQVTPEAIATGGAARTQWRRQLGELLTRFDLLVTPTLLIFPPTLDNASELLEGRCTLPVNFAGVPALSLPVPARGPLPASVHLVSAHGTEEFLLAAGAAVETAAASG